MNIVCSARIASSKISSFESFVKRFEIDAAPATQHAEEDPSPIPGGISESITILIQPLCLNFFIISLTI